MKRQRFKQALTFFYRLTFSRLIRSNYSPLQRFTWYVGNLAGILLILFPLVWIVSFDNWQNSHWLLLMPVGILVLFFLTLRFRTINKKIYEAYCHCLNNEQDVSNFFELRLLMFKNFLIANSYTSCEFKEFAGILIKKYPANKYKFKTIKAVPILITTAIPMELTIKLSDQSQVLRLAESQPWFLFAPVIAFSIAILLPYIEFNLFALPHNSRFNQHKSTSALLNQLSRACYGKELS